MAVFTKNLKKHIFIHPADQRKIHAAVRTVLMKDRKKYSDSIQGALLDVNNIKVIGDRHLIVNGYLSMEVMADFQIFAPSVGMTLQGRINKVHKKYCGCVTKDFFNATLSYPEEPDMMPSEGDTCSFIVNSLIVHGDILQLRGQLTSIDGRQITDDTSDAALKAQQVEDSLSKNKESLTQEIKEEAKESSEESASVSCSRSFGNIANNSFSDRDESFKKKRKKKSKEDRLESSTHSFDTAVTSDVDTGAESMLEKSKSLKKKHKKKSKEDRLESSVNDADVDASFDVEQAESHKSLKKKHKKKLKEVKLELNTHIADTAIDSGFEPANDSVVEDKKISKKKLIIKLEEVELETNTTMTSESVDTLVIKSDSPKTKSKKKHKKRHRSDDEAEKYTQPFANSVPLLINVKKFKKEDN